MNRRGNSLIEFALVLPLLLLLIINVVNFGAYLYAWVTVANAVRSGAQYLVLGGASVGLPRRPEMSQVFAVVNADLAALPNQASIVVRACTNNNGAVACETSGTGTFTNPAGDPEPGTFVEAWVDARYTYQPLLGAFNIPGLGVYTTIPSSTIGRRAVMRLLQ